MIFLAKVGCTGLDRVTSGLVDIFDLFNLLIRCTLSICPVASLDENQGRTSKKGHSCTTKVLSLDNIMEIIGKIFLAIWKIIKWYFLTSLRWTLLLFGLIDLWLGNGSFWRWLNKPPDPPTSEEIEQQLSNMTVEELLKQFGNSLQDLEKNNQLTPQQQKVVRKVRRVSPSEIRSRIRDVLTEEEEMEILLLLILRLLGILR